jgi:hypothetical protein
VCVRDLAKRNMDVILSYQLDDAVVITSIIYMPVSVHPVSSYTVFEIADDTPVKKHVGNASVY